MKLSKGRGKKGKANCLTLKGDTRDVVGAAVAMGERLEAMEGPEAKKRQAHGQTAPGKRKNAGGNLPPATRAKTRAVVGAAVGMSGKSTVTNATRPKVNHGSHSQPPKRADKCLHTWW